MRGMRTSVGGQARQIARGLSGAGTCNRYVTEAPERSGPLYGVVLCFELLAERKHDAVRGSDVGG